MGRVRVTLYVDEELWREFRKAVRMRIDAFRGALSRAFEEAIRLWLRETETERHTIPTRLKAKYPPRTEFGSGLVTCLVKFSEHAEDYKVMMWHTSTADLWFYGASDHLLGLECPQRFVGTDIEGRIRELRRYVAKYRLAPLSEPMSEEDVIRVMDLVREIAMLIDKELGLEPDIGEW